MTSTTLAERESSLKSWATTRITESYDDYSRLLDAKMNELKALIASSGGRGSKTGDQDDSLDDQQP